MKDINNLLTKAKQGNTEAQSKLGQCYYTGEGVTKNLKEAVYWCTKAAEQGHALSQLRLGSFYVTLDMEIRRILSTQDYKMAAFWWTKAAEQGVAEAQFNLAIYYLINKKMKEAKELIAKAAEKGLREAQKQYGILFWDIGEPKEAVKWWEKAAMQGSADDKDKAIMEFDGVFINGFYKKAEKKNNDEKYCEQGDADAQFNLGLCYYIGEGVDKDLEKAVYWYSKAAEQGRASAQFNLGICYENGEGVDKDLEKAVYWYTKAAEQGDADAQGNLGLCYENGEGVTKDHEKAMYWCSKAALKGNATAQSNLGKYYYDGEGVTKDSKKAVDRYTKSAQQGNAAARINPGEYYYEGEGVTKETMYEELKQQLQNYEKEFENDKESALKKIVDLYEKLIGTNYHDISDAIYLWVYENPSKQILKYILSKEKSLYDDMIKMLKDRLADMGIEK